MFNIDSIKETYQKGTRIELIEMTNEPYPVEPGEKGTVHYVDDMGTIHMKWDNGSSLGLIPYVNHFKIIKEEV